MEIATCNGLNQLCLDCLRAWGGSGGGHSHCGKDGLTHDNCYDWLVYHLELSVHVQLKNFEKKTEPTMITN